MNALGSNVTTAYPPQPNTGPLVAREKFADMLGLPVGVVVGWCNKGLVPTLQIGKYSLINVELLRKRCLEKEFL